MLPGPEIRVPTQIENELLNSRCEWLEGRIYKMKKAILDFLSAWESGNVSLIDAEEMNLREAIKD